MSATPFALAEAIASKQLELDRLKRELASHSVTLRLPTAGVVNLLRCRVDDHPVVMLVSEIDEVLRMAALTSLPEAPPSLAGMLTLGRERIPILDLGARETGVRRVPDPADFLVLTRTGNRRCGLLVQAIDGLVDIDAAEIHRPNIDVPFGVHVLGMCSLQGESFVLISASPLTAADFPLENPV